MAEASGSESARLAALYSYDILDTPFEPQFDELTALASEVFAAPIAVINFIDRDRQWFKSEIGLGVRETPLETSFCVHALLEEDMMVVADAQNDDRFAGNPLVSSATGLRFYAGAIIRSREGEPIGTLCILDYQPRPFTTAQQRALRTLANQVMAQLEQKRALRESELSKRDLARLNEKLNQRDASREQAMAMISHEMRNPLSPIMMTLDALGMKPSLDEDVSRGVDTIRRQTKHLIRLIDDLLDTSRITTGKVSLQKRPLQLRQVVSRSVEMIQEELDKKSHRLHITVPEQELIICADDVRLNQLFSNLLNNAIRYTPEAGQISFEVQVLDDTRLQVTVSDSGIGIPRDYIDRIFGSFVQVPKTGGHVGGLGVGLHLCKHIVHLHGGEINALSDGQGSGSRFTVTMPIIDKAG